MNNMDPITATVYGVILLLIKFFEQLLRFFAWGYARMSLSDARRGKIKEAKEILANRDLCAALSRDLREQLRREVDRVERDQG